jgi:subtilisin family serine protease
MKRTLLSLLASVVFTLVLGAVASAGVIEPHFAAYLETLGDNEFASAIVYLQDRPDIQALDEDLRIAGAPMTVRHAQVLGALQDAAQRSQPALLTYLGSRVGPGSVEGYTPYWIMNMVVVSATPPELKAIANRADVEAVEANFAASLISPVGDPISGNPLLGIGVTNSLKAINADRVWRDLGITGAGTLIANLDTGVDGNHPALATRWRGNSHPASECWRDALGGGTTFPVDFNGHGTHTMGTMTGAGHATGDTVGVAFNAQWIADNAIDQGVSPGFDNDVLDAFQWFADPDGNPGTTDDVPDVVQNSWGIDARFGFDYQDCDFRWQQAIENCEAAGIVVTFSAGNEGPTPQTHRSPANIQNSPTVNFAVGAVDAESFVFPFPIAGFSSRGPSDCDGVTIKPEVSAPGVNVYSSLPGGSYGRLSGTSMAGPHVAGVVALMREANPNADVQTIKTVLMNTSRDEGTAGEDNTYGWGVIDAYAAVLAVMVQDTIPPTVTVTAPNGGEVLTVGSVTPITWTASDNVGVTQSALSYSTDNGATYTPIATLAGNPGTYNWTVPNTPSTQSLVRVVVSDGAGLQASDVSNAVFTIQAAPGPFVFVQSIDLALVVKGPNTNAKATVLVRNQNGSPVGGAQVTSHWSGLTSDSDAFTTKMNGTGTCNSDRLRSPNGCWTYTVDNVVVAGHTFRTDLGEITDVICTGAAKTDGAPVSGLTVSESPVSRAGTGATFSLALPDARQVRFAIYNASGQRIKTLVDGLMPAGSRTLTWDGTDESGGEAPKGIYFYRVLAGDEIVTRKMILFVR